MPKSPQQSPHPRPWGRVLIPWEPLERLDSVALEKIARAHAYVVEEVFRHDREGLLRGGSPRPRTHFYYSDLLKMVHGNF